MSRIGRLPVAIPAGVTVKFEDCVLTVKGALGTLTRTINERNINLKIEAAVIHVERANETKEVKAKHGLYRMLVANMVEGVTKGYSKKLIVNGVGYKSAVANGVLTMNIGFSHPVVIAAPQGITITLPSANEIEVKGFDKELVGQVAANIKAAKPVEPYHGYGIRYSTEALVLKEGKTGGK